MEKIEEFKGCLEQTGSIKTACAVIGVSEKTVHQYRKNSQEFDDIVQTAIDFFKESHSNDWEHLSISFTTNLLKNKVTKKTTVRRFYAPKSTDEGDSGFDPDGELVEVYREEREEQVLPPRWLIERFLPSQQEKPIQVVVDFGNSPPESLLGDDPEAKQLE
jgi:hypothetical protein